MCHFFFFFLLFGNQHFALHPFSVIIPFPIPSFPLSDLKIICLGCVLLDAHKLSFDWNVLFERCLSFSQIYGASEKLTLKSVTVSFRDFSVCFFVRFFILFFFNQGVLNPKT